MRSYRPNRMTDPLVSTPQWATKFVILVSHVGDLVVTSSSAWPSEILLVFSISSEVPILALGVGERESQRKNIEFRKQSKSVGNSVNTTK